MIISLYLMATVQMIIVGNWLSGTLCCLFWARTAHRQEEAVWCCMYMSHDHQQSKFCVLYARLLFSIYFYLFSNPFNHFSYRDQFSQSSQFHIDKILAFFRIEYPLNIQLFSMSLHALVSEISFFNVSAFVWTDSGHIPIESSSLSRFNDAESIPTEKQLCASSSAL